LPDFQIRTILPPEKRERSKMTIKNRIWIIVIASLLVVIAGGTPVFLRAKHSSPADAQETIWHALPLKYGILLVRDRNGLHLSTRNATHPENPLIDSFSREYTTETENVHYYIHPGLTEALRGVVVSNSLVAADMRHLIRFCEAGRLDGDFWIESVSQKSNQWIVVERYRGPPDNSGVAIKFMHYILTDDHGTLTNMMTELHFRRRG
jgi:hypothetical protein